ncbi:hypothetical protein MMC20_000775 [Loxospora ochrophaea]|nr:hypothetical protein [Loxospora ochrophaea]
MTPRPKKVGAKGDRASVKWYIECINPSNLLVEWNENKWWQVMGDEGIKSTGGMYHIETMKNSAGQFLAKIVGSDNNFFVVNETTEPTNQELYDALIKKFC